MNALTKYEQACAIIAEAITLDVVKEVRDVALAQRIYAQQANNRKLEADAVVLRLLAERRLGELIVQQKKTAGLNKGVLRHGQKPVPALPEKQSGEIGQIPPLSRVGISHKLSSKAQKLAAIPLEEFNQRITQMRSAITEGAPPQRRTTKSDWQKKLEAARGKPGQWRDMLDIFGAIDATEKVAKMDLNRVVAYLRSPDGGQEYWEDGNLDMLAAFWPDFVARVKRKMKGVP